MTNDYATQVQVFLLAEKLKTVAKKNKLIYLSQVARLVQLPKDDPKLLGLISEVAKYSYNHYKCFLIASIVDGDKATPSKLFMPALVLAKAKNIEKYSELVLWASLLKECREKFK